MLFIAGFGSYHVRPKEQYLSQSMMTRIRVCLLVALISVPGLSGADFAMQVTDKNYLDTQGFSVFLYDSTYHPVFVDQKNSREPFVALADFDCGEHRHVARAFCNRRHQPAPGLFAIFMGNVSTHAMGLGDVHRHPGVFLFAVVPVHSLPADDFDLRDAHDSS